MNRQYLDPLFFGSYPEEVQEMFGEAWPDFPSSDFDSIRQRVDFLGINYYKRAVTRHDPQQHIERASHVRQPDAIRTELDWELYPAGLTDILVWVKERYGNLPMYVTENGACFYDPPAAMTMEKWRMQAPPSFEFTQVQETFFQRAQLRIIQIARRFLAIPRDERHGGPFVQ